MSYDFSGKNAVVTGASRGIGKAIAKTLSEGGARVALVAEATRRDLRVALSTSSGFGGTNAALVFARADVSGDLGVEARASVP